VSFGSGGETKNWAGRIHEFEIAGRTFQNTIGRYAEDKQGSFSSRTEAGNIGTELLANFTVDFDYTHNRIWFDYVPGYTQPPFQRSGMSLYRGEPKRLSVANILPGGPAAKEGLRKDDVVVTIAGKQAELIGRREVSRILSQSPGTVIPVTYVRDGKEFKTEIALEELLP
jgi:C-terminal processing protease CtpA/Prc